MAFPFAAVGLGLSIAQGVGSVIGGMQADSASNSAAAAQNKYNQQQWQYNWDNMQADYQWQLEGAQIARENDDNIKTYQEQTQLRQWGYNMGIRDYRYQSQMQAYERSNEIYNKQRLYNEDALGVALQNQSQWFNERVNEYNFAMQDLGLDMDKAETDALNEMMGLQVQSAESQLTQKKARQDTFYQAESKLMEAQMSASQAQVRGAAGQSTSNIEQSILYKSGMDQGQLQAALMIDEGLAKMARGQLSIAAKKQADDMTYKRATFGNNITKVGQTLLDAASQNNINIQNILLDKFNADLKAYGQKMMMPIKELAIPLPLQMPRAIIQDPRKPIKPPKPPGVKGSGSSNTIAGIANGLGTVAGGVASYNKATTPNVP